MKNKKLLLVGGGSGGHFVPIFLLAQKIKSIDPRLRIKIIGSGTEIERAYFSKVAGYSSIVTGKFHRYKKYKNIVELIKLFWGLLQSLGILLSYRPDVIFSKGGYASVPIIFWAKLFRRPYFIHESDIVMGKSNLYAADKAIKVYTGFPESFYDLSNAHYVGQMIKLPPKNDVKIFKNDLPTVVVLGGSQGAQSLNKLIYQLLGEILPKYNLFHQVGRENLIEARNIFEQLSIEFQEHYKIADFLHYDEKPNITDILSSADVVVCRAGATTMAETAVSGKPMILVPYIYASGDHQYKNAMAISSSGGAIVITEDKILEELAGTIGLILSENDRARKMTDAANKFFKSDAIENIANDLINHKE
ncbi:MAG: UDP-N-acetylglucosamine--N-acetylmuramyl-(pentapeptide) pyrophosphoryl-undecaprenol N-acetylglucosamine transferase [Candidatus Berkelbacteria bacterium]